MGELIDRALQRQILARLSNDYPASTDIYEAFGDPEDNSILVNIAYLEEHGLLKAVWIPSSDEERDYPADARITAKGLDFLTDDGGLGAILGVVTVKLHDDTLKALLIKKIEESAGDDTFKDKIIDKIKNLPADSVNEIAKRLLERGLDQLPSTLAELLKWLPF